MVIDGSTLKRREGGSFQKVTKTFSNFSAARCQILKVLTTVLSSGVRMITFAFFSLFLFSLFLHTRYHASSRSFVSASVLVNLKDFCAATSSYMLSLFHVIYDEG